MSDSHSHLSCGRAQLGRGEFEDAFRSLKAASAAMPRDPGVPHALGEFCRLAGNAAGANPHDPAQKIRLYELAIQAYALRADTPNTDDDRRVLSSVLFNLAAVLQAVGNRNDAIRLYGATISVMPEESVDAAINAALLLTEAERAEEAIGILARYLQTHPDEELIPTHLMWILQKAKRFDEAVAVAQQAASRFPSLNVQYEGYFYRCRKGDAFITA